MILLDIDGVCLDLMGAIKKVNKKFIPDGVLDYGFKTESYGLKRSEVLPYLSSKKVFELETPYTNTILGIKRLKELDEVVGYTTVPTHLRNLRIEQMKYLGIDEYFLYQGTKPVVEFACETMVVIDDCPEVLDMYKDTDVTTIIITRSYNKDYNGAMYRFEDLLGVSNFLANCYGSIKKSA